MSKSKKDHADDNGAEPKHSNMDAPVDSMAYSGLSEIATQLEKIHNSFRSYNVNATGGENSLNLFTGEHGHPVRLVLEGAGVDSIADSLKRIADAITTQAERGKQ